MENNNKGFWKGALCGALTTLLVVGIIGGTILICSMLGLTNKIVDLKTEMKLKMIESIIEKNYLYIDEVDENAMRDSLVEGYVAGLDEPYTVYYNEEETTALFESSSGEFGGVGITIMQDITNMQMTFSTIHKNCPGEQAGFREGDILYKVDGEDVTGQDLDHVITKIRGEVGSQVELTVLRGDNFEEYSATLTRTLIQNQTVSHEMLEGKIGYIEVTGFEDTTVGQFEDALQKLTDQKMENLIIDLRGNPGGNLSVVVEMCDMILPEGTIVSVKDRNGKGEVFTSDEEHKLNVPLVVLVNGNSASASEIFAGAVKDYGAGTLVGTTTFGKGIVQNIYGLPDNTSFKITSSEYFTPNGTNIHGVGVEPDVVIEYEYDEENPEADNQLDKAIEILKNGM